MSLLERYILRGATLVFMAALGSLTAIIWVTQALRDFDLMTTKGQTILVFLRATSLVAPSLVMVIAPLALFGTILFTLNRLNADSELIVMSASGVSQSQIFKPFLVLTLAVTLGVGALSLWIMPASFAQLRDMIMKMRADFISRIVREGQFTNLDKGLVFHYRERAPGGGLKGIFIQDRRDPADVRTYIAESGTNREEDGQNYLVLENGSLQRQTRDGRDPIMVVFKTYEVDLAQFGSEGEGAPLKPRERSTASLIWSNHEDPYVQRNLGAMRAELHDRLVNPLYALVFGCVGFAALARARTTRQGRGTAIIAAVVVVVGLRVAGFGLAAVAARSSWAVWALYGLPVIAILSSLWWVFGDPLALFTRSRARDTKRLRRGVEA